MGVKPALLQPPLVSEPQGSFSAIPPAGGVMHGPVATSMCRIVVPVLPAVKLAAWTRYTCPAVTGMLTVEPEKGALLPGQLGGPSSLHARIAPAHVLSRICMVV